MTYNMVNKEVLLSKLLTCDISGGMFHFIRSFLSNRTFRVRIGSTLSMTKRLENVTPQSSVLSLILFSLMINDLPKRITSHAALYADDLCFWECGSEITLLNQLCQRFLTKCVNGVKTVFSSCLAPNLLLSCLQGNTIQNLFPCVCRAVLPFP